MTYISSVYCKTPSNRYSTEEIIDRSRTRFEDKEAFEIFAKFLNSAKIDSRAFALKIEEIFALNGNEERAELFLKRGRELGYDVASKLLAQANAAPGEVGGLVFASCSVPTIPSLETLLMQDLALSPTTVRVPVYQYGCAGGAAGLSLASSLAKECGEVMLLSVELCSLVYQGEDLSRGNLVGSALFADGAAGVLVSNKKGALRLIASQSYLIPESHDLMGYYLKDEGSHLKLDKELPKRLAEVVPSLVENFLRINSTPSIDWWLFHPGGVKILDILEETFNLRSSQCSFAKEVLRKNGNMSSASILFVLENFLSSGSQSAGDKVLMLGIGPGLSVELLLFEVMGA